MQNIVCLVISVIVGFVEILLRTRLVRVNVISAPLVPRNLDFG